MAVPAEASDPSVATTKFRATAGAPAIEQLIGELVATAACLVAHGLRELKEHGQIQMDADTRQMGGELMSALITLRAATAGALDFDRMARAHGARALQERCDGTISQRFIGDLVGAVLEIMVGIIRLRLH